MAQAFACLCSQCSVIIDDISELYYYHHHHRRHHVSHLSRQWTCSGCGCARHIHYAVSVYRLDPV